MTDEPKKTDLAKTEAVALPSLSAGGANDYLMNPSKFEHIWRIATCFAKSRLVPMALQGKPEDCFILTQLALRLNVEPFMLMQNTYVVHGKPGMEAKLQIGLLNASGRIHGQITYTFDGEDDDYGCTAHVIDAVTREKVDGPKISWKLVKAEGWHSPKGKEPSKWATMPEQMFRYRAASFLIRAHYPEVTLGLQTREELEDMVIDVDHQLSGPAPDNPGMSKSEAIAAQLAAREMPTAEAEPEADEQPDQDAEAEPTKVVSLSPAATDALRLFEAATTLKDLKYAHKLALDAVKEGEKQVIDQHYRAAEQRIAGKD